MFFAHCVNLTSFTWLENGFQFLGAKIIFVQSDQAYARLGGKFNH